MLSQRSRLVPASILLIAPFFLWGTAMVAMKGIIPQTTPLFMAGVRILPAGILLLLLGMLQRRSQPKTWKGWLWISLFAFVDGTLFQGFLAMGLVRTSAGLGSVMIDSQPLAVAVLSRWLFGEIIGFWGWLGLFVGIGGISLIGLPDELVLGLFQGKGWEWVGYGEWWQNGESWMLLAALSMAVGTILIRYVSGHADPIIATGWHMIIGGIPLFALSAWGETQQWTNLGLQEWLSLGYATIFGSAIAYGIFFYIAATSNLTSFSSLTFLTPIFALLFGNLFLSEQLTPLQWTGVTITLASIYLVNQRETLSKRFQPSPTAETEETVSPKLSQ